MASSWSAGAPPAEPRAGSHSRLCSSCSAAAAGRSATLIVMPVFRLDDRLVFPPVHLAEDGLLALGGDLRPERLLLGYTQGIFPWYAENLPILWHSPDPRMVMTTRDLVIQRSLRKAIRKQPYRLTMDQAFPQVLEGCASVPRPGQTGTWLIPEMVDAYGKL